jgi:hypothetical protein
VGGTIASAAASSAIDDYDYGSLVGDLVDEEDEWMRIFKE